MTTKTKPATNNRLPEIQPTSKVSAGVKRIRVSIRGLPPGVIFQGKGVMQADADNGGKPSKPRPPEEEARLRAHWMGTGSKKELCIPWVMIYLSICKASESFKFRDRKKMSAVVPSTISCEQDKIGIGTAEFETYVEYARIPPKTGGMVPIGRARVREWQASFTMIVDDEMYPASNLREILIHAGKLIGIGAWRPQLKGPYGRFEVVEFEIL